MKNRSLLFSAFALLLCSSGCSRRDASTPVVVHVFRDPAAREIDAAIRSVSEKGLTTADKHPILIATLEAKTYQEGIAILGRVAHPDIVILNSADDVKLIERTSLRAVKTATGQYFIGVSPWSEGKQRETSEQVISSLRAALESDKH